MEIGKPLLALEFQLSLGDFLETVRMREPRSSKLTRTILTVIGSAMIAALLAAPFFMKDVPGFLAAFLLGVLPLAVLMVILPWYYMPSRFYKSYFRTHVFKPCKVEIGDEGISISTDTSGSVLLWKAFSDYAQTQTQIVLTSGMVQYILPKRLIEAGKYAELNELVRNKVTIRAIEFDR